MFDQEKQHIESQIRAFCQAQGLPAPAELSWSQIPFAGEWGISTSLFQLAADEARLAGKKINVPQRAAELAAALAQKLGTPPGFARVEAVKGYLNLYFSAPDYAARVLETVAAAGDKYGWGQPKSQRLMVEFSQPNTHKAFHVGHLRNMILGAALANILEAAGYEVVRANYIGDFGKDVFKWLWNYAKRHKTEQPPAQDVTRWMGDLYAEATRELEANPGGEEEIRALFARWEADDQEVHALWQKTRQWSLDGFNEIYTGMGVHFDRVYYESEMEKPAKAFVEQLITKGLAVDERAQGGPVVVKLDELLGLTEEKYRVLVLLRSDGTSLYGAWDLALAITKFDEYKLAKSIYVVDVRQSLHFQQVFKTLELAGHGELIKKVLHLPYEVVNLPGNVIISSREGVVVLLEELIREAVTRTGAIVTEKNPELEETSRQTVARQVGLAAIKYPMLARENTKIATFDWETALDFNGQAAPYIQYSHVRANSILRSYYRNLYIKYIKSRFQTNKLLQEKILFIVSVKFDKIYNTSHQPYFRKRWNEIFQEFLSVFERQFPEINEYQSLPFVSQEFEDLDTARTTNYLAASEIDLINNLSQFPDSVQRAAAEYKTLHITNLAYETARAFNDFYNQCPVLQAEGDTRLFRLSLVSAAKQTLANSLALLGIQAPEFM